MVYQVRQHKISVFVFQARDVHGEPSAGGQNFVVNSWQQNGLQFYVVTDAAKENTERLRILTGRSQPAVKSYSLPVGRFGITTGAIAVI